MLCELYTFGCIYLESLVLIAMLVPTQDLLLRLYIGELRGRNISTILIYIYIYICICAYDCMYMTVYIYISMHSDGEASHIAYIYNI